jgi:hypothetical protein
MHLSTLRYLPFQEIGITSSAEKKTTKDTNTYKGKTSKKRKVPNKKNTHNDQHQIKKYLRWLLWFRIDDRYSDANAIDLALVHVVDGLLCIFRTGKRHVHEFLGHFGLLNFRLYHFLHTTEFAKDLFQMCRRHISGHRCDVHISTFR